MQVVQLTDPFPFRLVSCSHLLRCLSDSNLGLSQVSFYTVINIGALAGIGIIPIVAQHNLSIAYIIPLGLLTCGGIAFVAGTRRYVRTPPRRRVDGMCNWGTNKSGKSGLRKLQSSQEQNISLFDIFRISLLIVPFCVGYSQMPTTFIVQGTVMANAFGFLNVASLNSLDAISVLVFGSITANYIYPYLAKNGIKIPTTYKFALGSALGALAILWAIFVEHLIHHAYQTRGERINVLWQSPAYLLIGVGEIFAVSAAYEVAFTASPPDKKVLASAMNIFCVGGVPNMLCIVLYHLCSHWFTNSHGTANIGHVEDYATAHVGKYFFVLLSIMVFGVILNVLPWVRGYVESIEDRATDIVRTPAIGKSPLSRPTASPSYDEETPLLTPRTKKYQDYLKFASGPVYARSGSMRAGPSMSQSDLPGGHVKHVQYKQIPKLYGSEPAKSSRVQVATGPDGKPIKAGSLAAAAAKQKKPQAPPPNLDRIHSMS
jgi:proton-dependent oligopeptide transporter, POT family